MSERARTVFMVADGDYDFIIRSIQGTFCRRRPRKPKPSLDYDVVVFAVDLRLRAGSALAVISAEDVPPLEEAASILTSVKINYEKRRKLSVVERELLATVRTWLEAHPPPGGNV